MTTPVTYIAPDRTSRRNTILLAAALVGLVFLAHGLALGGAFIWDDLNLITRSPLIHAPDGLWRFWFTTQAPDYFPLTSTTWWLEWRAWGEHPAGYHLVNLLLHAASAILIWQILLQLKLPGAWLAAAIWAVHPVQVESIAWIAERKNTLSVALAAASMLLLLRYFKCELATDGAQIDTDEEKTKNAFYLCSSVPHLWLKLFLPALLTFTAALLAKTAVAPLAVVVPFFAIRNGRTARRAILETIPFAAITLALCAVTIYFQSHRAIASDVVRTDGLASRIAIAGRAVWFYLGKLIWPTPLAFVYPRWPTGNVSFVAFVPLLLLIIVFVVLWMGRRNWGWEPLGALAYFVLMLLPVLGLINIYFMRYSLVADHWQYAASIGPIALFATAVTRAKPSLQWAIGAAVVFSLVILSQRQTLLYRSARTLWTDTVIKNPSSWMAWMNLGHTFAEDNRLEDAKKCYQAASDRAPDLAEPYYSLATIDAEEGQYAQAVPEYQRAVDIDPRVPSMWMDFGHSLAQLNQSDRALSCFEKAIQLKPDDANQRYQSGLLLEQMHRIPEAIAAYQAAVTLQPQWALAHVAFGRVLLSAGRRAEAAEQDELALRIDPGLMLARLGLYAARKTQ